MSEPTDRGTGGRARGVLLWVLAFLLMAGAAVYQRLTGPTHPLRGSFEVAGQEYSYRLTRSGWSYADEPVRIPNPGGGVVGTLYYKRFKTDDSLTAVPMRAEGDELVGALPRQPAAGKLEYTIVVENGGTDPAVNAELAGTTPPDTTFGSVEPPPGWSCSTPPVGRSSPERRSRRWGRWRPWGSWSTRPPVSG